MRTGSIIRILYQELFFSTSAPAGAELVKKIAEHPKTVS